MRKRFSLKFFTIPVTLVVVFMVCVMVLYSSKSRLRADGRNILASLLEAPLFVSSAEASAATMAFPTNEAGTPRM